MAFLSEPERKLIKNHAIGQLFDHSLRPLQDAERSYSAFSSVDGVDDTFEQGQHVVYQLLSVLMHTEAAFALQSRTNNSDI